MNIQYYELCVTCIYIIRSILVIIGWLPNNPHTFQYGEADDTPYDPHRVYVLGEQWMTIHIHSCLGVRLSIKRSTWDLFSVPMDPIPLCHYGKKETMARVDLMEDEFDRPMVFEPDLIPDPAVAGECQCLGPGCGHVQGCKRP